LRWQCPRVDNAFQFVKRARPLKRLSARSTDVDRVQIASPRDVISWLDPQRPSLGSLRRSTRACARGCWPAAEWIVGCMRVAAPHRPSTTSRDRGPRGPPGVGGAMAHPKPSLRRAALATLLLLAIVAMLTAVAAAAPVQATKRNEGASRVRLANFSLSWTLLTLHVPSMCGCPRSCSRKAAQAA